MMSVMGDSRKLGGEMPMPGMGEMQAKMKEACKEHTKGMGPDSSTACKDQHSGAMRVRAASK